MYFSKISNWFETIEVNSHLYVIRERLDVLDDRFYTEYTNMYLITGSHTALLIDTGMGLGDIKETIAPIVGDRDLIVINSHNHFDHVGGNHQFEETRIHRLDLKKIMSPMDISFLKSSETKYAEKYKANNYRLFFADTTIPLIGNEIFDLGNLEIQTIYTAGHTPGSICLLSSHGELFTGDTINTGAVFLPGEDLFPYYLESLQELESIINGEDIRLFPGHEKFDIPSEIISKLNYGLDNLEDLDHWYDPFLDSWIYQTSIFTFVKPYEISM